MPWDATFNPSIDYKKKNSVGGEVLSEFEANKNMIELASLSVKKFRKCVARKKAEIAVSRLVSSIPAQFQKQSSISIAQIFDCGIFILCFRMFSKILHRQAYHLKDQWIMRLEQRRRTTAQAIFASFFLLR